jgi:putative sterol carrier protein
MFRPFTQDFADALCSAINADAEYRDAAKSWTWPTALLLEAAPELGYPESVAIELDLDRGTCRSARLIAEEAIAATFTLRASYATWKDVVTGALDPIMGVTRGVLRLKGPLTTLMLHTRAAKALVQVAMKVPVQFADE